MHALDSRSPTSNMQEHGLRADTTRTPLLLPLPETWLRPWINSKYWRWERILGRFGGGLGASHTIPSAAERDAERFRSVKVVNINSSVSYQFGCPLPLGAR